MTPSLAPPGTELEQRIVDTIRTLSLDAVQKAKSGHPGLPMGGADFATVLWTRHLRVDPAWPEWPGRDRFVLSAGHGSMLLYSLLHLAGYDLPLAELERFRQWESRTPGHPEFGETAGVETTTGPLGQGLANAVGMALAERLVAARFPGLPDGDTGHRTYCFCGDGDLMEGIASEAASLAGHWKLSRLMVWYDSNRITIDGGTDLSFTEDVAARFRAYGWHVIDGIDGHDREAIDAAIREAHGVTDRPTFLVGKTRIAHGSPHFEGTSKAHGAPLGEEEVRLVKERLGFDPDRHFQVLPEVRDWFGDWARARAEDSAAWRQRADTWKQADPGAFAAWDSARKGEVPGDLDTGAPEFPTGEGIPTRKAGQKSVQWIAERVPALVTGSADLFESNLTAIQGAEPVAAPDYRGRNLYFGVREHAMAGICNGLALHGGVRPVGSTFLVFADYLRPSLRLAALMGLPVLHVFTHDSVWVGEDGPTHQPVEHLDSLRIIPGLHVVRPADARETVRAWAYAIRRTSGPTVLVLTRQALPVLARPARPDVPAAAGMAGVVHRTEGADPAVVLVASGSEVSLCTDAAPALEEANIPLQVVSVPCLEEFALQPAEARDRLLPPGVPRLFVEAGTGATWGEWMQTGDAFHGIRRFGASAPGAEVARHLGLSADAVVERVRGLLGRG